MDKEVYDQVLNFVVGVCKAKGISVSEAASLFNSLRLDILEKLLESSDDYYVLKNDGRIEKFEVDKLYASIAGASDEMEEPLNKSDVDNLLKLITGDLFKGRKHRIVPTREVRKAVLASLDKMGFHEVLKKYEAYLR